MAQRLDGRLAAAGPWFDVTRCLCCVSPPAAPLRRLSLPAPDGRGVRPARTAGLCHTLPHAASSPPRQVKD